MNGERDQMRDCALAVVPRGKFGSIEDQPCRFQDLAIIERLTIFLGRLCAGALRFLLGAARLSGGRTGRLDTGKIRIFRGMNSASYLLFIDLRQTVRHSAT